MIIHAYAVIRWYLEMEDHNQNINNDNDKEKKTDKYRWISEFLQKEIIVLMEH